MRFSFPKTGTTTEAPAVIEHPDDVSNTDNNEKAHEAGVPAPVEEDSDNDSISKDAQAGVKDVEALAKVWSKEHLIAAYIMIWVINFVNAMQQGMSTNLTPYVTSAFALHSLTAATSIMSSIIGGLFKLPLAKILDIWGRPQGFAAMTITMVVGLIMMAACNNVKTYAAAQVFYWIGYNGMDYSLSIFVADTSSLKNRSFWFAYASSPYIITVWITGPIATAFLNGPGFRWGFGAFAFITLGVTLPLNILFAYNYRKARKAGLLTRRDSGRTFLQSAWFYFVEFDAFGILLLAAGLALFLLPFSLYSYQSDGWKSPMIICMIIFGGLLMIAFALYEKYLAPKTFIPYNLLANRTVMGANIFAAVLFVEFYLWDGYFSSFLQVVNGLSITRANYVTNIYSLGSCFCSLIVGVAIRYTGRFKWVALYFGIPLTFLGVGLMVYFRQPDQNVGYIVMCQIFIAFGGGACVIAEQMAVMASTDHQHVAVVLAVEGMFSSIGGAIGSTIASAIWTGVFPEKLGEYLPADAQADLATIYESLVSQLSYPKGSDTRTAIDHAYGDSQRYMCIAATCVLVITIPAVLVWRDIKVKDFKQVKGRVA